MQQDDGEFHLWFGIAIGRTHLMIGEIFKMIAFITVPLRLTPRLIRDEVSSSTLFDQSMTNQHACPCCSHVLLRHIRLRGVYWRCDHCGQEMPAWV